jgi:hypothetical protein
MTNYTAGTIGDRNRNVIVGNDNQQHDTRADNVINNHFDAHGLRASFDEGFDEGMSELSRLIREFNSRIALLEYRITEMEKASELRARLFYGVIVLLLIVVYKLFFGHVG